MAPLTALRGPHSVDSDEGPDEAQIGPNTSHVNTKCASSLSPKA